MQNYSINILVTGSSGGLGRFLTEHYQAQSFNRNDPIDELVEARRGRPFEAIIHCAFNATRDVTSANVTDYFDDNVGLARRLLDVPHQRFVFLSTVDIYPATGGPHGETAPLLANEMTGAYAIAKFLAEAHVRAHTPNHVILRPVMMIGRYMRRNSLVRVLTEPKCRLTVRGDSRYNIVRHVDVAMLLDAVFRHERWGTYNVGSGDGLGLREIAARVGHTPEFGDHLYRCPDVDCRKAHALVPHLGRSSLDVIDEVLREGDLPDPK